MTYDLVIFDCDGVMFDSRRANEVFYNDILAHFGLPPMDLAGLNYVHMATAEESVNFIIQDPEVRARAQKYRLSMDFRPYNRYLTLEPDLVGLLERLRPERKTAICTNRALSIFPLLEDFGLSGYFDTVVSATDVTRPKPAAEPMLLVLERLGVAPGRAVYIGDSETDAGSAKAAGVAFAAYGNPDLEADYHIDGLGEAEAVLGL